MKRSARSLFLERLSVWFREMGSAKWAFAAGTAYALLMVLFFVWPKTPPADNVLEPASLEMKANEEKVLQFDPGKKGEEKEPSKSAEF